MNGDSGVKHDMFIIKGRGVNKKAVALMVVVLFLAGIGALGVRYFKQPDRAADQGLKLQVITSFYPLYYFAKEIGGDKAVVINITPAGAEPHDYEPTAEDIARVEKSKILILNGGGLEAWADKIRNNIDPRHTIVVIAGEGLATRQVTEEGKTVSDPHVWLSPFLAKQMVDRIAQGFIHADPDAEDYYRTNADVLKAKLDGLDTAYRLGLSHCKTQSIVTSHAAFGYLAATYKLKQVSITGLAPDIEPSPRQLIDIVKFARENQVKYIFFESLVSPKLSQTIANEVGAQTLVLNPIEGLTNAEMAQGKNYLTEMQSNLTNLKRALQCN